MDEQEVISIAENQSEVLSAEEKAVANADYVGVSIPETTTEQPPDHTERIRLENEAYQRHFSALQEELAEIRKQFAVEEPLPPDPVAMLSGQVSDLRNGFQQLQQMLEQRQVEQHQSQQQAPQQIQFIQPPQQQYAYFQPQPMFQQTSPILPAPALPYFATPALMPTNTQAPVINFNGNGQNGGFRR